MKISHLLFIYLLCSHFLSAQHKESSFRNALEQSHKVSFLESDSLSCEISHKDNLSKLLAKNDWEVSDLEIVDCLLVKAAENPDYPNRGLIYYIGGIAHAKFDDDEKEIYFQKAYVYFESKNDIEGMFFSLAQLFNSKIKSVGPNKKRSENNLSKLYNELAEIAKMTNYGPVKLVLYEYQLRKKLSLEETISEKTLDSITTYAEENCCNYPDTSKDLFDALGNVYNQKGDIDLAFENFHKAVAHAKSTQYDFASYYINLGSTHYANQNIDSAMYYFKTSYDLIPEDPKTIYLLESKGFVEYNLGIVHEQQNEMDQAFYYAQHSLQTKNKQMNLQLDINRIYAEKKFEIKKNELRVSNIENELLEKKRILAYLITSLFLVIIIMGVLFIIYQKTKRKQSTKLAKDRERLFRIINHDLNSPLQVFATTASLLPKLIEKKKFAEIEKMQESLSLTSIALQNTLNNLFAWSDKMKIKARQYIHEESNITQEIEEIVATYTDLAQSRGIHLQINLAQNLVANTIAMKFGNLVRNLIYNAVQHGDHQSTIYIELKEIDKNYFSFSCNNIVPNSKLEKVKNVVSLLNSKKNKDHVYLGLGLELILDAICCLNAKIEARLDNQKLSIYCSIPK